jgi:hypothetical protein
VSYVTPMVHTGANSRFSQGVEKSGLRGGEMKEESSKKVKQPLHISPLFLSLPLCPGATGSLRGSRPGRARSWPKSCIGGATMLRLMWRLLYNVASARSDRLYAQWRFGASEKWGMVSDWAADRCW